jgi:predicted Zn-dependent protease
VGEFDNHHQPHSVRSAADAHGPSSNKSGTASTREFDDESLQTMVNEAQAAAKTARDNPNLLPLIKAITTDFWGNLDAISGKDSWQMFGTGGDAKGQPTQTNSISHGSPWLRIKKIMVGAAYA